MKPKRIKWLIGTVLTVAILLAGMSWILPTPAIFGEAGGMPALEEVGEDTLLCIKQAYIEDRHSASHVEEVTVLEYCGTYRGCVVLMLTDPDTMYLMAVESETVGGVLIWYNDSNRLYAWKDGALMSLSEAYAEGHLTRRDIRRIRSIHYGY